jgi:hypothetical protein
MHRKLETKVPGLHGRNQVVNKLLQHACLLCPQPVGLIQGRGGLISLWGVVYQGWFKHGSANKTCTKSIIINIQTQANKMGDFVGLVGWVSSVSCCLACVYLPLSALLPLWLPLAKWSEAPRSVAKADSDSPEANHFLSFLHVLKDSMFPPISAFPICVPWPLYVSLG